MPHDPVLLLPFSGPQPSLEYDFVRRPRLTGHVGPDLSFTRATSATMVDADGWIREVQSGEARFDGATFRENLQRHSEALSSWTNQTSVTISDSAESVDHNGQTIQLSRITDDATNSEHAVVDGNSIPTAMRRIYSFYVKSGTLQYVICAARNDENKADIFDANSGAWVVTGNYNDHNAEEIESGVYRIWFSTDSTISADNDVLVGLSDDGSNVSYSGSGDTIFVGGVMVEEDPTGSRTTPGDYIKTTASLAREQSGTSNGILIEEARTNLAIRSEEFDNAAWTKVKLDVDADATTAPDGATTADRVKDDSSTGSTSTQHIKEAENGLTSGENYCFSVFGKPDQLDWIRLVMEGYDDTDADASAYFDLQNGSVGTVGAAIVDSGIKLYANGFYRCWIVYATTTDTSGFTKIKLANGDNDDTIDLDGTSSVFLWGAQFEQGSKPSSYMKTVSSTVTRNKDECSATITNYITSDGFGTWYVKAIPNAFIVDDSSTSDDPGPMNIAGNGSVKLDVENINTSGNLWARQSNGTGDMANMTGIGILSIGTQFQLAFRIGDDDAAAFIDGSGPTADATVDTQDFSTATLNIGYGFRSSDVWNGHIGEIRYYREKFPNATIDNLSNGIDP